MKQEHVKTNEEAKKLTRKLNLTAITHRLGVSFNGNITSLLTKRFCRKHNVLAEYEINGELHVIMSNPQDQRVIKSIERKTKLKVVPIVATFDNIEQAIPKVFKPLVPGDMGHAWQVMPSFH